MPFDRQDQLHQQIDALKDQISLLHRELGEDRANDEWLNGHRGHAMVLLSNYSYTETEMIRFARQRGLSEAEARQVIQDAPIDW
jgi:hypothetical protein